MKLEITLVFSIEDAISDKKGTTIMTSHNDRNKKARQEGNVTGPLRLLMFERPGEL